MPEPTGTLPPPALAPGQILPFAAYGRWHAPANVQSGIQLQNLSALPTDLTAVLVDEDGAEVLTLDLFADVLGAPNVYLPTVLDPIGAAPSLFGLRVSSDAALGAIVRTDWFDDGGAGIAGSPLPSRRVLVPSFVRRTLGRSSMAAVANAGTRDAEVVATLHTTVDGAPVATATRFRLPVGTTRRIWADFEAAFQPLGPFEGWLAVESDGSPLAVQVWEVGEPAALQPRTVAAFEGVPDAAAANDLIVPLFRSAQRGVRARETLSTRIVVVNPGPSDVEVTIAFTGAFNDAASPVCRGATFHHPPTVVPAGGRRVFRQAPGGGHNVPTNCFGSARITTSGADERVVAMAYDATAVDGAADVLLSAFVAQGAGEAAGQVAMPLWRRNHVGLSTGIQVMNPGLDPVEVEIAFSITDPRSGDSRAVTGCTVCQATIEPDDSVNWWPPAVPVLRDGTFGGAVVTADGPVVVLVNDYPTADRGGRRTDPATYLGLAVP